MAYKYDYIKEGASVEWQRKVDEIRQRDKYTCQLCGAQDKQVQVHHTWYNQELHYWEYPDEQLVTLCKDCHSKETGMVRRFRMIKPTLDTNIVNSFESLMKQGVLLTSLINVLEQMETKNVKISKNDPQDASSQLCNPTSPNIEEKVKVFLKVLQPFESEYNKDYIQTFKDYWLAENNCKLRFEIDENGNTMDAIGISPTYMEVKLENWKSKYEIVVRYRQSSLILDEIQKKVQLVEKEYLKRNKNRRCLEIEEEVYGTSNRLFGKILFDRGLFAKRHRGIDRFLQLREDLTLCCPLESVEEEQEESFATFCLLYEANQAFKRNRDYNCAALSSIDSKITFKSFCDKHGIKYSHSLKKDKSVTDMIDSIEYPIKIEYRYGAINVRISRAANHKRLLKLNKVFGLQLLTTQYSIATYIPVPYKVLYMMDGTQFDFRDDSFENGTMKSVKLPTEYKDAQFYLDKIEEMLNRN